MFMIFQVFSDHVVFLALLVTETRLVLSNRYSLHSYGTVNERQLFAWLFCKGQRGLPTQILRLTGCTFGYRLHLRQYSPPTQCISRKLRVREEQEVYTRDLKFNKERRCAFVTNNEQNINVAQFVNCVYVNRHGQLKKM
jgi:hypothetical protein